MGDEDKAKQAAAQNGPEPAAAAEKKKGDGGAGEVKKEDAAAPPPPPEEVVLRVFMHCQGCARKVKKILTGFDGVEDVSADSKAHKVVVKGKKAAADPMKVVERVQKKTSRKVELLSPLPPPKEKVKKEEEKNEESEPPKPEEKKEKPTVVSVVLKVHMHCEACADVIKKRILKMKGVESAEPDLKASQITVKGVFEEAELTDYLHRRTGKHAAVVKSEKVEPENKAGDGNGKDDKKAGEGGGSEEKKDGGSIEEKKDGGDEAKDAGGDEEKDPVAMVNLYRFNQTGGYGAPGYSYQYAPQLFSDENPNACCVM